MRFGHNHQLDYMPGVAFGSAAPALGAVALGVGVAAAGVATGGLALIPAIAIGASVASAGVGAAGAIQSADAQAASAKYQAAVANNNATIAKSNAAYALEAGNQQATAAALQTRNTAGAAVAAMASNGLDVNSGSNENIRSSNAVLGQQSVQNAESNAYEKAYGYETGASNFTADAGADQTTATNAMNAGLISATGSVLNGTSSTYKMYQGFNTNGVNLAGGAS